MIVPSDFAPLERTKGLVALGRVTLEEVRDPGDRTFHAAYALLDAYFGALGELEDRDTLAGFVRKRRLVYGDGVEGTYHLVAAWCGEDLVGVRDCYVDVDHPAGVCIVALSHCFVAPAWRRSGLAALLRAVPHALARRAAEERGGAPLPTLLVTEMEPVDPARPETVVRLLAYGRSGFAVLDPSRVRYSQVEFRDIPGASHTGMPMLGVVRPLHLPPGPLPVAVVASFTRLFYACHRGFVPAARVDPSESFARGALHASEAPVQLLPLPTSVDDLGRLEPLVRGAVLPLYPPGLRGDQPRHGDADEEIGRVLAAWGGGG